MFIAGFPTSAWQSNCYVLAAAEHGPCVVVDPGPGALDVLVPVLAERGLEPAGVLLTHGHIDHIGDAARLCDRYGVPAWLHPADRALLTDPARGLGRDLAGALAQQLGLTPDARLAEPADVRELVDGEAVDVAGLAFGVRHAPGHTPGCALLLVDHPDEPAAARLCLSGDVLFAGSIGRTDLPGGDHAQMLASLRDAVLTLDDATAVLPGHGPRTTIGAERAHNPYLLRL